MSKEGGRRLRDGRVVAVGKNGGVRKIRGRARRVAAKRPHPWHFNFKWNDRAYRFSLDREVGRRLVTKADATVEAERFRREYPGRHIPTAGRRSPGGHDARCGHLRRFQRDVLHPGRHRETAEEECAE